jgi:hypothetical protein
VGARRRLSVLEEQVVEEQVQERLEAEFEEFFEVLEEKLPRTEFLRVLEIAARGGAPWGLRAG